MRPSTCRNDLQRIEVPVARSACWAMTMDNVDMRPTDPFTWRCRLAELPVQWTGGDQRRLSTAKSTCMA